MWVTLIASCCDLPAYYFYSSGDHKYVLNYIHEVNFKDLQDINNRLRGGADHVRLVEDTIPKKSIYIFRYFANHLLHVIQKDLPLIITKRILKDALCGIAELHDQDIVHTGSVRSLEE
jgi:hypothetical protein